VIERFKSLTITRYIEGVKNAGWLSFPGKLWQRGYHDRIIRNATELTKSRTYICNNPSEWDTDENNLNVSQKTEPALFGFLYGTIYTLLCLMQPKRKSQRKKDYDYSQSGYYAVTICTQGRSCLFGIIDNDDMQLNDAGRMVNDTWHEMPKHYPGIELDMSQVLPTNGIELSLLAR